MGIPLAVLALALSSCAGTAGQDQTGPLLHIPGDTAPADSSRFAEASAILRIIDASYWSFALDTEPESQLFLKQVDRHKIKHPDLWTRALDGVAWAHDSAHCAGEVWRPEGDVRWPYFVRFGPPSVWWVTKFETAVAGGNRDTVLTFFYRWNELDTGIAAQAESTGTYPTKLLGGIRTKSEVRRAIYPSIDVVSFPDRAGTFDIWIITGVRGRDLTYETLESGVLQEDIKILGDDKRLVATQDRTGKLALAGLILSVTVNSEALSIPSHFEERGLPAGKYTVEANVRGYRTNASGTVRREFVLPSPFADRGVSDILLADLRGPCGEGITPGVLRNGRNLQGISEPIFGVGDTISPYVEIRMPEGDDWACVFSVFLKPVLRNPVKTVKVSRSVLSADSLGKPLVRWAGVDLARERRELGQETRVGQGDLDLIFARVSRSVSDLDVFESSFEVSRRASSGDYWLIIEIEGRDSAGQAFNRSIQKKITLIRH